MSKSIEELVEIIERQAEKINRQQEYMQTMEDFFRGELEHLKLYPQTSTREEQPPEDKTEINPLPEPVPNPELVIAQAQDLFIDDPQAEIDAYLDSMDSMTGRLLARWNNTNT